MLVLRIPDIRYCQEPPQPLPRDAGSRTAYQPDMTCITRPAHEQALFRGLAFPQSPVFLVRRRRQNARSVKGAGFTGYPGRMSSTARESWRVRIRDGQGGVHGAGVLVTPEHVLSCARVVAIALGADPSGRCPDDPLVVDFPGCSSAIRVSARPLRTGWAPVAGQRGAIAVLALVAPPPGAASP